MELNINEIQIKERIRKDDGKIKELEKSIIEVGLINPITINEKNELIAGYRRLMACKNIGWKKIDVRVVSGLSELKEFDIELQENIKRKDFTDIELAEALLKRKELYEREHPETKKGIAQSIGMNKKLGHDVTADDAITFVEETSKKTGMSERTVREYLELNKLDDDIKKELHEGKSKKTSAMRKQKKREQIEKIKELKPVEGKFHVIVVDPPWPFQGEYDPEGRRLVGDYPTMSIDEIKKIKLPMEDDCILWLWGCDVLLKETLEVIEAWGFNRKSTLIWVKDKIGLGAWLRNQHEYCFLCVKGKPIFHGESTSTILNAKRGKHSEKPEEFYQMVEKVCPYKDKLDYFARKKREGWIVYGDEA